MTFFPVAAADPAVIDLLGSPPRIYPAGDAPKDGAYPYATYQRIGGAPMQLLSERASASEQSLQIDVWAKTNGSAQAVCDALIHAIELRCSITSVRGPTKDATTGSFRCSIDALWIVQY